MRRTKTRFRSIIALFIVATFFYGQVQAQNLEPSALIADLKTLSGKENPQRLKEIIKILDREGIAYSVEPFTYDAEKLRESIPPEERDSPHAYDAMHAKGQSENLVVTLGKGDADIVIGAHYDRVHIGDGLVDNGASSIILTRLAKALKNEKLNYRIKIVWFGEEELGLIGSRAYVKQHKDDNIVSMINLDVNGYGDTTMMGPTNQTGHNRLYQLAKQAAMKNGFKFLDFPNFGGSDNISFTEAGIEAIGMSTAPWDEAQEFWMAFNGTEDVQPSGLRIMDSMHSPNDTMKIIDPSAMQQNYTVVLDMVKHLNQVKYVQPATIEKPLADIKKDVKKLAGKSNDDRLKALQKILNQSGIAYSVEPYTYDPQEEFKDENFDEWPEDEAYRFIHASGKGSNLVVTLGEGEQEFVVGAHYDKVTVGEGVVDNGASSIILARIASALKDEELNFKLRIVWFGDEEIGHIGSRDYVKKHKDDNIIGMIALDVNSYGDTIMMGPSAETGVHHLYKIAQQVCTANDIPYAVFPQYGGSDNEAFTAAGFEAMGMGIAPKEEAYEFWLEMNGSEDVRIDKQPKVIGNMHSAKDTMDMLDPMAVTKTYAVTLGVIRQLSKELSHR